MVIISFTLSILMHDSGVLLWKEIRFWLLLGFLRDNDTL